MSVIKCNNCGKIFFKIENITTCPFCDKRLDINSNWFEDFFNNTINKKEN